MAFKFLVYL